MTRFVTKFSEAIPYEHSSGPNCEFFTLLPKDEIGDLNLGYVTMKGPTSLDVGRHDRWHQVYVVIKGKGRILIGDKEYPVESPCLVRIPFNTDHAMKADAGEEMLLIYVNQHLKND